MRGLPFQRLVESFKRILDSVTILKSGDQLAMYVYHFHSGGIVIVQTACYNQEFHQTNLSFVASSASTFPTVYCEPERKVEHQETTLS